MKSFLPLVGAVAALAFAASTARANLLINGSLESAIAPQLPDNLVYVTPSLHSTALTGWTIDSGSIDIVPNSYFQSAAGAFSVDLVGTPGVGSISQQVVTTTTDSYTLSFEFSINPEKGPRHEKQDTKILRVEAIGADGSTILASQDFSGTAGTRTLTNMQYAAKTFTFTADGAVSTIRLLALTPTNLPPGATAANIFTGPVVDNLDLELGTGNPPTPEPASLGMLLAGSAALLIQRRRRVAAS